MSPKPFADRRCIRAVARCVGERIDVRALEQREEALATAPLTVRAGVAGIAMVLRYGAVVLFELAPDEEAAFLRSLAGFVGGPFAAPESDEAEIRIEPGEDERIAADGAVVLREASLERLQIVAHVLAKSALLAHYEAAVATALDRIEPLAVNLRASGSVGGRGQRIVSDIGNVLLTQTRTVGRAEVAEQPEVTWDQPSLERLYARLSEEYDLRERDLILERKLALISRTAETLLSLLQNRRILRVEWYIVVLIAVEIVIIVWDMMRPD